MVDGVDNRTPVPRVVRLSPEPLTPVAAPVAAPPGGPAMECVTVGSPYEAAAELIAAPAAAIVIDLRLMGPRHLRLLQIARQRGVEILAVGGMPGGLSVEDLSGVRLIARADLPRALRRLLELREGRFQGVPSSDGEYVSHSPLPLRPAQAGEGRRAADGGPKRPAFPPADVPATRPSSPAPCPEAQAPPRPAPPASRDPQPAAQSTPPSGDDARSLLTADELSALLEDAP
jgi:hypothetical protein